MKPSIMSMFAVAFVMCVIVSTSSAAEAFDPSPIYFDTSYVSEDNYQGSAYYDVTGLTTNETYVLIALEFSNIDTALASWGNDPEFFTAGSSIEDQMTSCQKDDQDAGLYMVSLYRNEDPFDSYGQEDAFLKTVNVLVDW